MSLLHAESEEAAWRNSGLRSLSNSLISIINPLAATALYAFAGLTNVVVMDLGSFLVAFIALLFFIHLPERTSERKENVFCLAREPLLWCIGQGIGWLLVPVMSANLDVILRGSIPVELQGRVYACRNTLQFFTIPIGLFWGGFLVDAVCEPFMAAHRDLPLLQTLFGSGAALMMFLLGVTGSLFCLLVGKKLKQYHYRER